MVRSNYAPTYAEKKGAKRGAKTWSQKEKVVLRYAVSRQWWWLNDEWLIGVVRLLVTLTGIVPGMVLKGRNRIHRILNLSNIVPGMVLKGGNRLRVSLKLQCWHGSNFNFVSTICHRMSIAKLMWMDRDYKPPGLNVTVARTANRSTEHARMTRSILYTAYMYLGSSFGPPIVPMPFLTRNCRIVTNQECINDFIFLYSIVRVKAPIFWFRNAFYFLCIIVGVKVPFFWFCLVAPDK